MKQAACREQSRHVSNVKSFLYREAKQGRRRLVIRKDLECCAPSFLFLFCFSVKMGSTLKIFSSD